MAKPSLGPADSWGILRRDPPSGSQLLEYADVYRFGSAYASAEQVVTTYSRVRQYIGIAIGVAALVATAAVLYLVNPSIGPADSGVVSAPATATQPAEMTDLHPPVSRPSMPSVDPKPAPAAKPSAQSTSRSVGRATATIVPIQERSLVPPVAKSSPRTPAAPQPAPAVQQPGSVVAFVAPTPIYSASDADVVPPEPTHPQQLTGMRTGAAPGPGTMVTLEVIVNSEGVVEAAWSRTAANTVGESLVLATSLHAVKAWQFHPAVKNGTPVSYRKLISFEGF